MPGKVRVVSKRALVFTWAVIVCICVVHGARAQQFFPLTAGGDSETQNEAWAAAAGLEIEVNSALDLTTSSIQTLVLPQDGGEAFSTTIQVDGQTWTLDLHKQSVRSREFQVLVQVDHSGELLPIDAPPIRTYRGSVREIPEAEVRGSLRDGKLTAVIRSPLGAYGVQPVSDAGVVAQADLHVVYRAQDWVNREGYRCGATDAHRVAPLGVWDPGSPDTRGTGLKICDLGVDSDYQFYQMNGYSVPNTVHDIETVINGFTPYYEVPAISITYEISAIIVRTTYGAPYTSYDPDALLCQLRTTWNTNPESYIKRDTAHLFTGKNLSGTVIGVAWLGAICTVSGSVPSCTPSTGILAYGLSESRFTTNWYYRFALTAHEIGHNWNATHCDGDSDCWIMCSDIAGCSGGVASFGSRATGEIAAYRASRNCLVDLAAPLSVPFFDDFPVQPPDSAKWPYNSGCVASTSAYSEPSSPRSLNLDRTGSTPEGYLNDDIRSNYILLAGASDVMASFYVEHRGVEAGEELIVEYWRNGPYSWAELARITSDGSDQTEFVRHSYFLPGSAYHNEFRIRFRPEGDESNDDWFVDDVSITEGCLENVDCTDGDICTDDACDLGDCEYTNNTAQCDDGQFCTTDDVCSGGVCGGAGDPCPGQMCDEDLNACVDCLENSHCDDQEVCTDNSCNAGNCEYLNNNAPCNDEQFCTVDDTCSGGVCTGSGDPCPGQVCDEDGDTCVDCLEDGHCDDGIDCTIDQCISVTCERGPDDASCNDGVFCNGEEICDQLEGCQTGADPCPGQACDEESENCVAPATLGCTSSSSTAFACGSVELELFLQNALDLQSYEVAIEINRTSGAGNLTVAACPGGIVVDTNNQDFVFYGMSPVPSVDCNALSANARCIFCAADVDSSPGYLATYVLEVSNETTAGTTFEVSIAANPATFLRNSNWLYIPFEVPGPCTITISPSCVEDSDCDDENDCTLDTCDPCSAEAGANGCLHDYQLGPLADVVSPFCPPDCPQPDLEDIMCVLNDFADGPSVNGCGSNDPPESTDLSPCGGNGVIDVDDLLAVLDAFG